MFISCQVHGNYLLGVSKSPNGYRCHCFAAYGSDFGDAALYSTPEEAIKAGEDLISDLAEFDAGYKNHFEGKTIPSNASESFKRGCDAAAEAKEVLSSV